MQWILSIPSVENVLEIRKIVKESYEYCKELPTTMLQDLILECLSCLLDVNEKLYMLAFESYMEEL